MVNLNNYLSKKKLLDFILIISLIIFVIISLTSLITTNKEKNIFKNKLDYLDFENKNIRNNLFLQLKTNGLVIDSSAILCDENGISFTFNKLKSNNSKLVLRYSPDMCGSCIDYVIEKLRDLEREIHPANIIIISCFENYNSIKIFKQINNLHCNVYNLRNPIINYPLEKYKIPPVFILKDNKIESVFILDNNFQQFNTEYLSIIKEKYFK